MQNGSRIPPYCCWDNTKGTYINNVQKFIRLPQGVKAAVNQLVLSLTSPTGWSIPLESFLLNSNVDKFLVYPVFTLAIRFPEKVGLPAPLATKDEIRSHIALEDSKGEKVVPFSEQLWGSISSYIFQNSNHGLVYPAAKTDLGLGVVFDIIKIGERASGSQSVRLQGKVETSVKKYMLHAFPIRCNRYNNPVGFIMIIHQALINNQELFQRNVIYLLNEIGEKIND